MQVRRSKYSLLLFFLNLKSFPARHHLVSTVESFLQYSETVEVSVGVNVDDHGFVVNMIDRTIC